MDFRQKVVLITGGAQGIGNQIARDFLERQALVSIFDVNEEILENARRELSSLGSVEVYPVDVVDSSRVSEAVDKIIDKHTKIDILINNAGITRDSLLLRLKEEDWDKVIAVNLKGVFNTTRAVLKYMVRNRKGKIVNISSIIALMGNPGQTNYGASKAALIGFTKSLAKEVASRGVCVNAVAPGYIKTSMTERLSEEIKARMLQMIPLGRFGEPRDVSKTVLFLSSSWADYITGKVIVVDGGML